MEISKIQYIDNRRNIYSPSLIRKQSFTIPIKAQIQNDCFVRTAVDEKTNYRDNIPLRSLSFLGGIKFMNYEFETKFNKVFFTKLLREGIPDAYSDIERLIPREELDAHRAMGTFSVKSQVAIKHLRKYKNSMFPVEREIFTILENLSKKHPNMTLQDLLRLRYPQVEQSLINQQSEVLNKINMMIRSLPKKEYLAMRKLIQGAFDKIFAQDPLPEERFGRKRFFMEFEKVEISDKRFKDKIRKAAEALPQSSDSVNAFIIKYSQPYRLRYDYNKKEMIKLPRDSQEIGERLLEPSVATVDHIHPQASFKKEQEAILEGELSKDELSTLRVTTLTSSKTNSAKTNIPLDKYIKQSKYDIPQRIQNQIDRYIYICEKWLKQGRIEDADLLADYIIVLRDEYQRRSKLLTIDISELESKLPQLKAAVQKHNEKMEIKLNKRQNNKNQINNRTKNKNRALDYAKEILGKDLEDRKVQKHSSRYSG